MNILVNDTKLKVINAYAERGDKISLFIHVSQKEISYEDLKNLFKNNSDDIIKTDGRKKETFSSFSYVGIDDDDINDVYVVKLYADENDFQLGRNRQLEEDIKVLKDVIESKDAEIEALKKELYEKDALINNQTRLDIKSNDEETAG